MLKAPHPPIPIPYPRPTSHRFMATSTEHVPAKRSGLQVLALPTPSPPTG